MKLISHNSSCVFLVSPLQFANLSMILERLTTMKTVQALSGPSLSGRGSRQTTVVAKLNRRHEINGC